MTGPIAFCERVAAFSGRQLVGFKVRDARVEDGPKVNRARFSVTGQEECTKNRIVKRCSGDRCRAF